MGIFLTDEGIEALRKVSEHKRSNGIEKTMLQIYERLKEEYRELNKAAEAGRDVVIYCPERKIGKSTAIIKLAAELGVAIATERKTYHKRIVENYNQIYGNSETIRIITLKDLCTKTDGKRLNLQTVLVDQTTDMRKVREALNHMQGFGTQVNIIAIQ